MIDPPYGAVTALISQPGRPVQVRYSNIFLGFGCIFFRVTCSDEISVSSSPAGILFRESRGGIPEIVGRRTARRWGPERAPVSLTRYGWAPQAHRIVATGGERGPSSPKRARRLPYAAVRITLFASNTV